MPDGGLWGMGPGRMTPPANPAFQPTRWSLIAQASNGTEAESKAALETICGHYWYPLYAYVRSKGHSAEDAQDLTQSFFAQLVDKDILARASPERGRLRTFLLNACQNFLINEWHKSQSQRRGGGVLPVSIDAAKAEHNYALEPAHRLTPEALYHRRWAITVLERALLRLRTEYEASGRLALFEALKPQLEDDRSAESQREVAARHGMSEGALRVAVFRLRQHHRRLLFEEVAESLDVSTEAEVRAELASLIAALG